jgi:lysozyme
LLAPQFFSAFSSLLGSSSSHRKPLATTQVALRFRSCPSQFFVLTILQRSGAVFLAAGLGLSFATPALASEPRLGWPQVPPPAIRQLALLPQLPAVPRQFAITHERQAMLNTIRYAEGTWVNGDPSGYRMLFGGSFVHSLDRHPDRVMYSPRYASAAAGAYQFMPFTWSMVSNKLGLRDFQPQSQDQGALYLIQRRGGLHLVDRGELTPELAARLAPEWASFPTLAGSSYYGQPVKRFADLRRFYDENLTQLRQGVQTRWEPVPIRQLPSRCLANDLDCRLRLASVPQATVEPSQPEAVPAQQGTQLDTQLSQ